MDWLNVASMGSDDVAIWIKNVVEKCEENDGSELSSVAAAFVVFLKDCGVLLPSVMDGDGAHFGESVVMEVVATDLPSGGPNPHCGILSPAVMDDGGAQFVQSVAPHVVTTNTVSTNTATLDIKAATDSPHPHHIYAFQVPRMPPDQVITIPSAFAMFKLLPGEFLAPFMPSDANSVVRNQQAIVPCRINDAEFSVLIDTGADTCVVHSSLQQLLHLDVKSVKNNNTITGFGGNRTSTNGLSKLKLALVDAVYFGEFMLCEYDPSPNPRFHMILGMDFLATAGMMVDTSNRHVLLPDGYSIPFSNVCEFVHVRKVDIPIYANKTICLRSGHAVIVPLPDIAEVSPLTYWINRGAQWIATLVYDDNSHPISIRVVNISKKTFVMNRHQLLVQLLSPGYFPVSSSMVRLTSNRYSEWIIEAGEGSFSHRFLRQMVAQNQTVIASLPPAVTPSPSIVVTSILSRSNSVDDLAVLSEPSLDHTILTGSSSPTPEHILDTTTHIDLDCDAELDDCMDAALEEMLLVDSECSLDNTVSSSVLPSVEPLPVMHHVYSCIHGTDNSGIPRSIFSASTFYP